MQPNYLNTYKIYIQNAKVMKKNESDKKKRDYFALSLALAAGRHAGMHDLLYETPIIFSQ